MKVNSGFTLIELILVVLILALLSSLTVPAMRSTYLNGKLRTSANELVATFAYARIEAIRLGNQTVLVCPDLATSAGTTCSTGSGNWNDGWIVFESDSSGKIFQRHDPLSGGLTIAQQGSLDQGIEYLPNGMIRTPGGGGLGLGTLTITDGRGCTRALIMAMTGRVRVTLPAGQPQSDCEVP